MTVTSIQAVVEQDASIDLPAASVVEVVTNPDGRLWVNVDGICCLRIKAAGRVTVEVDNEVRVISKGAG